MKTNTTLYLLLSLFFFTSLFAVTTFDSIPIKVLGHSSGKTLILTQTSILSVDSSSVVDSQSIKNPVDGLLMGSAAYVITPTTLKAFVWQKGYLYERSAVQPDIAGSLKYIFKGVGNDVIVIGEAPPKDKKSSATIKIFTYKATLDSQYNVHYNLESSKDISGTIDSVLDSANYIFIKVGGKWYIITKADLSIKTINYGADLFYPPQLVNGFIYVGDVYGNIHKYNYEQREFEERTVDGPIIYLKVSGGKIYVLTARGRIYSGKTLKDLKVVNEFPLEDNYPFKIEESLGTLYLLYGDHITAVSLNDGLTAEYSFRKKAEHMGLMDFIVDNGVAYVAGAGSDKGYYDSTNLGGGCVITEYSKEVGYIPFKVSGFVKSAGSLEIKVLETDGTEVWKEKINTDKKEFSLYVDPKLLPKDTQLMLECKKGNSKEDIKDIYRNSQLPKDSFKVKLEPNTRELNKGDVLKITVLDSKGLEVTDFNVKIDGEAHGEKGPTFTVSFEEEGEHYVTLSKDGFNTGTLKFKVKGLPLLLIGGVLIIVIVIGVYIAYSKFLS